MSGPGVRRVHAGDLFERDRLAVGLDVDAVEQPRGRAARPNRREVGLRRVATVCGLMIAIGLVLASYGGLGPLYASNLLLVGLLGGAGMFSPMMAYVSRWFDRHRGSAIALVSSGQFAAGALWNRARLRECPGIAGSLSLW